jgi:MFS family permease
LDYIGWLVCVVVFQVIFFQLLDGWPFRDYENKLTRLVTSNVFVIGMGWLLYVLLHNLFHWPIPTIIGACGVVAAGVTITAMAFEDYPFHHERPGLARLGLVMNALGMAFLSFFVLRVIGQQVTTFKTVPVELWVGISALNFIAPMVIFLYAIWGRWPLPAPAPPAQDDALAIDRLEELQQAVSARQTAETHAVHGTAPPATPASWAHPAAWSSAVKGLGRIASHLRSSASRPVCARATCSGSNTCSISSSVRVCLATVRVAVK